MTGKRCDIVYFGSNIKMSKTDAETMAYIHALKEATRGLWDQPIRMFVIPSFTVLDRVQTIIKDTPILLGAQNIGFEERGAYTGEISPLSLLENGVSIAEIGHSERRRIFGETDTDICKKVDMALKCGLSALLCIGETAHDKATGISDEVLNIQLKEALVNVTPEEASRIWIAYEPAWSIGENGTCAAPDYVELRHRNIKNTLCSLFGERIGSDIPALYGGSVSKNNIAQLVRCEHVNGLFVGRSAWSAEGFASLAEDTLLQFQQKRCAVLPLGCAVK